MTITLTPDEIKTIAKIRELSGDRAIFLTRQVQFRPYAHRKFSLNYSIWVSDFANTFDGQEYETLEESFETFKRIAIPREILFRRF